MTKQKHTHTHAKDRNLGIVKIQGINVGGLW